VANRHRFIHLREKSVVPCGGVLKKLSRDAANRMNLAKIDWESLPRAAKRDKDLRCPAAAIQAGRIDFSLAFWNVSRDSLRHFRCQRTSEQNVSREKSDLEPD
jgi:hypothetical protein